MSAAAIEFLRRELHEPRRTDDLTRAAAAAGISPRTLERARRDLGARAVRRLGVAWVYPPVKTETANFPQFARLTGSEEGFGRARSLPSGTTARDRMVALLDALDITLASLYQAADTTSGKRTTLHAGGAR